MIKNGLLEVLLDEEKNKELLGRFGIQLNLIRFQTFQAQKIDFSAVKIEKR